ncbi:FtsK/SpoIIIE domain-containing protein [Bacillus proteolyticus]|uniref:FtsK/SpoIIIE domain-containing protein n=1 Tax=Bacillus proteolyticus TaxID=2026192 RepID=UPI0030F43A55
MINLFLKWIPFVSYQIKDCKTFLIKRYSKPKVVYLRDILSSSEFLTFTKVARLPLIIGLDEHGKPLFEDLTDTLHMLIARATGSGKTYFLIGVILSLSVLKTQRSFFQIHQNILIINTTSI